MKWARKCVCVWEQRIKYRSKPLETVCSFSKPLESTRLIWMPIISCETVLTNHFTVLVSPTSFSLGIPILFGALKSVYHWNAFAWAELKAWIYEYFLLHSIDDACFIHIYIHIMSMHLMLSSTSEINAFFSVWLNVNNNFCNLWVYLVRGSSAYKWNASKNEHIHTHIRSINSPSLSATKSCSTLFAGTHRRRRQDILTNPGTHTHTPNTAHIYTEKLWKLLPQKLQCRC